MSARLSAPANAKLVRGERRMVTRRTLFGYGAGIAELAVCQAPADAGASGKPGFVTVDGQGLRIDGAPAIAMSASTSGTALILAPMRRSAIATA